MEFYTENPKGWHSFAVNPGDWSISVEWHQANEFSKEDLDAVREIAQKALSGERRTVLYFEGEENTYNDYDVDSFFENGKYLGPNEDGMIPIFTEG